MCLVLMYVKEFVTYTFPL